MYNESKDHYDQPIQYVYDGSNPDDFDYLEGVYEGAENTGEWWQSKTGVDAMKKREIDTFLKANGVSTGLGTTFKLP